MSDVQCHQGCPGQSERRETFAVAQSMCCVDQRHVGHDWPHIHTDATVVNRHQNNVSQTPAFRMDTTPKMGQRPTQNAAPQHLNTWQLKVPAKTPTRKTSNRREAANGRASSQQMRDRVFDLRIKQVSVPLRKTRRLYHMGQHARQRKKKACGAFRSTSLLDSKQRALLCHCERCPICLVDTRTLVQTKFGTAASVPRSPSALKTHHNQKRATSNSVRQDGTTWRTLHMSFHGLRA